MKNKIKHYLGKYSRLFPYFYRLFGNNTIVRECLFSNSKEIVIEGFPRSANTYSVVAFRYAQKRDVPIGHHLHVEAQIHNGVKAGVPVVVLLREPLDAIKSYLIRHPDKSVAWAAKRYVQFYSSVEKVKDKVVIADFKSITADFNHVICEINRKFNKSYATLDSQTEDNGQIFKEVENINDRLDGGRETHVARPSSTRGEISVEIDDKHPLITNAENLYRRLTDIDS